MLDLEAARIFALVVQNQSFSETARRLGVSAPVISKQVARLEKALDARLLQRTTRRLGLTEAGTAFYAHCVRMLEEADAAECAVSRLHAAPRGHLRVSATVGFGSLRIAPLLPGFLALYPEVSVELECDDRVVDLVDGGYDLALRLTAQPGDLLVARPLTAVRQVLCAAPAYLERRGTPQRPEELMDHNCLRYLRSDESGDTRWAFVSEGRPLSVPVAGNFSTNNIDALRRAAMAGLGIILGSSYRLEPDIRAGRLVEILGTFLPEQDARIYAVYPSNRHLSPKVRVFIDYLVGELAEA
ncbi:MAG: LysR family transcriptional regulator [Gammaproteobacteria bacterium]|jgi:DNA-binding transcriptional LysR family regulator|nr:LysR family transcriptional regulator [Gammaproteobacteria bacterium]MBU1408631.1 LysR family transcriptional regulator [Gammaproteobacteria bacterium]MBU1532443.1 LysR family transcriptional regulator [Gammaproteobacteria bacterium]